MIRWLAALPIAFLLTASCDKDDPASTAPARTFAPETAAMDLLGIVPKEEPLRLRTFGYLRRGAELRDRIATNAGIAPDGKLTLVDLQLRAKAGGPLRSLRVEGEFARILRDSGSASECFNPRLSSGTATALPREEHEAVVERVAETYRAYFKAAPLLDANLECAVDMPGPYLDVYDFQAASGPEHLTVSPDGGVILYWSNGLFAVFDR